MRGGYFHSVAMVDVYIDVEYARVVPASRCECVRVCACEEEGGRKKSYKWFTGTHS